MPRARDRYSSVGTPHKHTPIKSVSAAPLQGPLLICKAGSLSMTTSRRRPSAFSRARPFMRLR